MSEPEEQPKLDLDLGTAFLPSWAQKSAKENPYSKYEGRDNDRSGRRDSRRPDRSRGQRSGDRRRPGGDRDQQRRPARSQDGKGRPQGNDGGNRRGNRPPRQDRGKPQRPRHRSRQEIIASLPGLKVTILPDQKGVESLAKQIRMQGRAYPLFDIATLVLKRPDRFRISTTLQPDSKGQPVSEQWKCKIDDSIWLSQGEAINHVLTEHFEQFYEKLKTETDPPKGNFSFVAQCGISGVILGPPNYHGYQDALRSLHSERFSRMNFDVYKDRVKIVREEEVVKKWIDDQSWKTQYKSKANPDSEPIDTWEALIEDFKANHAAATIETGKTLSFTAAAGLKTPSKPLQDLIRFHVDDQRRFPLQVATILSQMFARLGLQFFKVNRTITHVSVARPKYLDMTETPVSTSVQKIVEFIDATPDCNRKKLFDALRPATATPASAEPAAATTTESDAEKTDSAPNSEESDKVDPPAAASEEPPSQPTTPEEKAIITDLHWLIHQGHVIEFSNGKMETAKKPAPRPEKGSTNAPKGDAADSNPKATEVEGKTPDAATAAAPTPAAATPEAEQPVASTDSASTDSPAGSPTAPAEKPTNEDRPTESIEPAATKEATPEEPPSPTGSSDAPASTPTETPSNSGSTESNS